MPLTITIPPAVEPVSVAEFRRDRRLDALPADDTTSVDYTDSLRTIQAAREAVEQYTRRALVTQTLRLSVAGVAGSLAAPLCLLRPPIQSITSVTVDGTAVATSDYVWDTTLDTLAPASWVPRYGYWPEAASIVVVYVAGYGATAASVPAALRQAVLRIAGDLWESREDHVVGTVVGRIPRDAESLMQPYRVPLL